MPTVADWISFIPGQPYDPQIAAATAAFAIEKLKNLAEGKGKGKGKGKGGGEIRFDRIEARGNKQAHEFMEDGKEGYSYYSFYYGAITDAQAALGSLNPVRVVVEVDTDGNPTRRYWMTEHRPIHNGYMSPDYQNWSKPETLP